ncbi:zonadhesin isoform X1 [Scophthalmus maximus]|uniref:zonadhesin isoform X1 n=1 Tax=Scophthalmus maximus TaxID=52904 RepID=UPI001FA8CE65|nr:zonadhesin isoform X1 [Scophthalmus maximus]
MLRGVHTDLLVTVTLLFLSQTGTRCRAENYFSVVPLPEWSTNSEYVTQCFYDRQNNLICDWARSQQRTVDVTVNILESGPLALEGEACLEFWYQSPATANGSEVRALLKSSAGLAEIWTSPALPPNSWRQVFVPLKIIKPETRVVLEAASMEGQITLNRIGVRRGLCGPQCESHTEIWTDESTRCLCSEGQLSCSPSQCPAGQICGPQRGGSNGISSSGTCTIHSHTDCSTFDGLLFRFMAPCTYILAKTCSPTEALPMFSVEVVNEQNGNSSLPAIQQVNVDTGSFRLSLLKRQTHRIVVNGVWRKLPLSLGSGAVKIKSNPAAVELGTTFGLSVSYDSAGAVHVALPSAYSDEVCGLCGNFNRLREDDFRKPDGTNAQDATALAKSWQTGQSTSSCETILVPHQCDPLEEAEYASELYCGRLLSSTGPFADCQSVLGAESYFRGCVVSMCSSHGDPAVLCETLWVYTDVCNEAGVALPTWRNSTFCPLQCSENSHYNSCADGCPEVCSSLDLGGSCGNCEERCECDSGFKLSGGKCVPAEDCGCWYNGKHYVKGATFVEGECVQQCQCMGNNDMWCTTMQCADTKVCTVRDGVQGCFPFKPATCRVYGDPHYMTFDRGAYDFQGGCSYTLTTTCGEGSSVQFTVIGHNMHPALQNFTRSKLEAVTLQVEDFYLTLNQSGEVYVNSSRVQLPYATNGTYGSVWVYMKNNFIILETAFGLRIIVDGQNRLFLQVDERYKYELCGLCGTYSGYQGDDFVTPGGKNATETFEFGDSWRVPNTIECAASPNDPRLCDFDEEDQAYNECTTLLKDAFSPCHEAIHPDIYLKSCVYDYCATNGDQHTLCESLNSYAAACQVAGVELPPWQTDTACADTPTTSTAPTPSTSPTPDQTFCPMNCDFEKNLCGWEQLIQDSFDWTRHSGRTPSDLTGPNEDHTAGAGFYVYIEGNRVSHGDSARLLSSMCHYNGPLCLHFWYHMYGSASAMAINIYLLKDNKATKLWSMMNNQGPKWHPGHVDIRVPGPFQIIVEGIRGSNAQSDVAIDDVSIHFGSCSAAFPGLAIGTERPYTTVEVFPSHPVCNLDCSFDSNLCSWNQMITDAFDWTWQSGSTPSLMTGPSADHTGDGRYLYIEASSVTHGDTARLISSECLDSGPQCLQFWYHMYGSADTMGLHVYLLQNRVADAVWWKRNDQGNMWHLAQVDVITTGAFQIIFEGRRGSNDQSDVAIDDISLHRGHCGDLTKPTTPAPELPPANNSSTTQQPTKTSSKLQPSSTTTFTTTTTTTTVFSTDSDTQASTNPSATTEPLYTTKPDVPMTTRPDVPITTRPQLSNTTAITGTQTTAGPHPTTEHSGVETSEQPEPETTEKPETTTIPQPSTTDRPELSTAQPESQTTSTPKPPTSAAGPQPPTTAGAKPPTTTARPQHPNTAGPQPPNITGSQPPNTPGPQPPTTVQPKPPNTTQPESQTTSTPQPPTTNQPQPQTTSLQNSMTARPQLPTTMQPNTLPTAPLESQTTSTPKPQTSTAQPQPPTPTAGPQHPITARPQTPNTMQPEPSTTTQPESQTTSTPKPPTSAAGPQPPTTAGPKPPTTTARPQHPNTAGPQPPTTAGPQPPTTAGPKPPTTTARPQHPNTAGPQPSNTAGPHHSTTMQPEPSTTTQPESQTTSTPKPPTSAAGPQPPTTAGPKPPTTTARPQHPNTAGPHPPNTAGPQPSNTAGPHHSTTMQPEPSTTTQPESQTKSTPQPPTTTQIQPLTKTSLQTPTTARPQPPTTTARPKPPSTTARPQLPTSMQPQPSNATQPESQTTSTSQPQTSTQPKTQTTTNLQFPTTKRTQPPTTARPQPSTETQTSTPQPSTTAQSLTTNRPQPPTTVKPHKTTATPQSTTTLRPVPTTTARSEPTTTIKPHPPTDRPQSTTATVAPQSTTTARPKPPTTAVSTPSCTENSHYTSCIPACSPTCAYLNGPPHCSDSDSCVPGCVCDEGYVQKRRRCVPIRECGCVDSNGTKHQFNEMWYTSHCSQKCECEKDDGMGKIDCDDKDECDGNAVCLQNNKGEYYCRPTGFSECSIKGDPEYRTFDKMKHDFEGEHSYVLVRTNNLPNNLPDVYIEAINTHRGHDGDDSQHHGDSSSEENRRVRDEDDNDEDEDGDDDDDDDDDDSEEQEEHHRLQELKIVVYNHTVELKKKRRLVVDGRRTKMPVSPSAGLNIRQHSSHIYLRTDFGLSVEFDGHSTAEIILPHIYKGKVGGLCGNFDSQRWNDWMKPDGTRARSVQEFGESWRV